MPGHFEERPGGTRRAEFRLVSLSALAGVQDIARGRSVRGGGCQGRAGYAGKVEPEVLTIRGADCFEPAIVDIEKIVAIHRQGAWNVHQVEISVGRRVV